MGKTGVVLVLLLVLSGPAAGRDIFVSNTGGDDRSTGELAKNVTANGPLRTIAKALRLAVGGDLTIVLAGDTGQPYRESVSLSGLQDSSGTARQPLLIVGNGAVLDGSAPVPVQQWTHVGGGVYRFRPPQMGFQQLFLDRSPGAQVAVGSQAASPPQAPAPPMVPLPRATSSSASMRASCPSDHQLTYASLPTGITLFQVDRVTIA